MIPQINNDYIDENIETIKPPVQTSLEDTNYFNDDISNQSKPSLEKSLQKSINVSSDILNKPKKITIKAKLA